MTAAPDPRSIARAVVDSVEDDQVVLSLPGTDYRLKLALDSAEPASALVPGKRIRGTITASALKIHQARGGGMFIEPVHGTPRIVAGRVLAVDDDAGRVLVDVAAPMWVTPPSERDLKRCQEGELVNFYVESGATFTPLAS